MKDQPHTTGQTWNTASYAANGRFVATLATAVVELLAPQPGEHILDLGCGDGALTEQLAATGAIVIGVDASEAMVAAARARGLTIHHASATALPYDSQFDVVFSNAAPHWVRDAESVLASVHRSLKQGGRFVAEMGGQGNIAAIRTALPATLAPYGIDAEEAAASFFPSPAHYQRLLEQAGFEVHSIDLIPRPTPLPDGMETWLNTFRNGVLDRLNPEDRASALAATVSLLRPILSDADGYWTADYVRLRFHATRTLARCRLAIDDRPTTIDQQRSDEQRLLKRLSPSQLRLNLDKCIQPSERTDTIHHPSSLTGNTCFESLAANRHSIPVANQLRTTGTHDPTSISIASGRISVPHRRLSLSRRQRTTIRARSPSARDTARLQPASVPARCASVQLQPR